MSPISLERVENWAELLASDDQAAFYSLRMHKRTGQPLGIILSTGCHCLQVEHLAEKNGTKAEKWIIIYYVAGILRNFTEF